MWSSFLPQAIQQTERGHIKLTQRKRSQKRGQRSATGPLSTRGFSLGKGLLQSSELSSSKKSSNASTSLNTGQQTPHFWSERSCSLLDAQISPQTSGSALSRDMRLTFQRSLERTTPLMWRPNSPKTLGSCSNSPFEFQSSPKRSLAIETGLSCSKKPSKWSLMLCQAETQNMLPTKHICQASLPLSSPLSTLKSLIGFKACLHKTNWSSQPPGSILPRQPPLLNSAWWATKAALQPPF